MTEPKRFTAEELLRSTKAVYELEQAVSNAEILAQLRGMDYWLTLKAAKFKSKLAQRGRCDETQVRI